MVRTMLLFFKFETHIQYYSSYFILPTSYFINKQQWTWIMFIDELLDTQWDDVMDFMRSLSFDYL